MVRKGVVVQDVIVGSVAHEHGIVSGDRILSVNGKAIQDLIDFHYFGGDEEVMTMEVAGEGTPPRRIRLERFPGEPLGILLAPPEPRRCGNDCIFCFVHQLPPGLRPPLSVKDEDYRLSFLYGNYVTLSNLSLRDRDRIVAMRLSPLYVSVHATDQSVRERLLGRKEKRPILSLLSHLTDAGISLHTQIVLVPGVNDGDILDRTIGELSAFETGILSIAIVPVGLTSHRGGLPPITPVDRAYAQRFLHRYEPLRRRVNRQKGRGFLSFADEWYLKAGHPFPGYGEYGDFPQIENGVGMVVRFQRESRGVLRRAKPLGTCRVTVVTGESAAPLVTRFCEELSAATGCQIVVIPVENRLFGESVTVAGLVSGGDIIGRCRGEPLGDALIVPDVMIKEGEGLFLDDLSVDDLSRELRVVVIVVESSPRGILAGVRQTSRRAQES